MDKDHFSILIVGLGLIGGSLAKALYGFRNSTLYAVDTDPAVIAAAEHDGVIKKGYTDISEIAPKCQLTILCVRPTVTKKLLQTAPFRKDSLVTDVCGVKQYLIQDTDITCRFRYIGGHPMAGRECSGYESSDAMLFQNATYLFTPDANSSPEDIALLKDMAHYIGCRAALITTPQKHDDMIAYTSQLMHAVAAALCDNPLLDEAEGYSAGSLRDCTRVAKLDAEMWTELFLSNRDSLIHRIDEFESSLNKVKRALQEHNESELKLFLADCSDRKRRYLNENPVRKPSK